MQSLKVLATRSVAARVTSEDSLDLEVPTSLIGDIVTVRNDSWMTVYCKESWAKKRTFVLVKSMARWEECPYCKFNPANQKTLIMHIIQTESCKKKQNQFLNNTKEKKFWFLPTGMPQLTSQNNQFIATTS